MTQHTLDNQLWVYAIYSIDTYMYVSQLKASANNAHSKLITTKYSKINI